MELDFPPVLALFHTHQGEICPFFPFSTILSEGSLGEGGGEQNKASAHQPQDPHPDSPLE